MILVKNDVIAFYKNFECVFFSNVKEYGAARWGRTIRPSSSTFLTIPVDFIYGLPPFRKIYIPQKYTINYTKITHPVNKKISVFTKILQINRMICNEMYLTA